MRRLVFSIFVTLDGFTAGADGELGWFTDVADDELDGRMAELLRNADGLLLGRVTYEMLGGYWPHVPDNPDAPRGEAEIAPLLNALPKHVISGARELRLGWGPAHRIGADVAGEVAMLKGEPGNNLVCFGGATTARTLMEHDLIDDYWITVHPVLLGAGQRLFASSKPELSLVDATAFGKSGAVMLRYRGKARR